jgi:hypothetical protein
MVPADIEVTQNTFYKNPCWNPSAGCWDGITRDVKDHFELKYGVRVLFQGNTCQNIWGGGGQGEYVNLNSTDQNGDCPWCRVSDVNTVSNLYDTSSGAPNAFVLIASQSYAAQAGVATANGTTTLTWVSGSNNWAGVMTTSFGYSNLAGGNINFGGTNYSIVSMNGATMTTATTVPAGTANYYVAIGPPAQMARVVVGNSLWYPTSNLTIELSGYIGTTSAATGIGGGNIDSVQIVHNTMPATYNFFNLADGTPYSFTNFVFSNNIWDFGTYGWGGANCYPTASKIISTWLPANLSSSYTATNNALATVSGCSVAYMQYLYPSTFTVGTPVVGDAGIGYSNLSGVSTDYHGYQLSTSSPFYRQASDGTDVGVNFTLLDQALYATQAGSVHSGSGVSSGNGIF